MAIVIARGEDHKTRHAGVVFTETMVQQAHIEQRVVMDEISMRRQLLTSVILRPSRELTAAPWWTTRLGPLDDMSDDQILLLVEAVRSKVN